MIRTLAATALLILTGASALPVFAETGAPAQPQAAEPRGDLSPTDDTELAPRTPPVNTPKPMERTRMGVPADSAPADRTAPAQHAAPPAKTLAQPRRAAPPRQSVQRRSVTPRRTVRAPQQPDTSLSTIFTQPRFDADAPLRGLAPQSGQRSMIYYYATVPTPPEADDASCPTRSRDSLGALFACTR
jgi:hypothetical protein